MTEDDDKNYQVGHPEKVCGGQTDNELIPNQTETYGSSWGDLNI